MTSTQMRKHTHTHTRVCACVCKWWKVVSMKWNNRNIRNNGKVKFISNVIWIYAIQIDVHFTCSLSNDGSVSNLQIHTNTYIHTETRIYLRVTCSLSPPLPLSHSLSYIITVCCHIDIICRVRKNGYAHIGMHARCAFLNSGSYKRKQAQKRTLFFITISCNDLMSYCIVVNWQKKIIFFFTISQSLMLIESLVWKYDCSELACMKSCHCARLLLLHAIMILYPIIPIEADKFQIKSECEISNILTAEL